MGKTSPTRRTERGFRKHPHVRGEDLFRIFGTFSKKETPPRAWGRHDTADWALDKFRNTPTCVGKTCKERRRLRECRKHPHVRGEDPDLENLSATFLETPPRAWGRRSTAISLARSYGNTPTCVGKTQPTLISSGIPWKHPHVRGEDVIQQLERTVSLETPPRAWGRHWEIIHFFY